MTDLIYWRDPRKSGVVFGALLAILLSLSVVSVVSVISYSALAVLTGTLSFRLYKNVLQAVQKTQDGHPFKYGESIYILLLFMLIILFILTGSIWKQT